ncbi:Ubiquitin carboxyl-terminal hydrolase 7 [Halotydeus destructor]|nr:Ubiquitin carboxyl-terminal hydrolase 7 [Halotydeus destructor]
MESQAVHVEVFDDESFANHTGLNLFDLQNVVCETYITNLTSTLSQLMVLVAEHRKCSIESIRLWPFAWRSSAYRPSLLDTEENLDTTLAALCGGQSRWQVFLEITSDCSPLPLFNQFHDVLLFFKQFDPRNDALSYIGHGRFCNLLTVSELIAYLNGKVCNPEGTSLILYEETSATEIDRIENESLPLIKAVTDLMDGDIIVFQVADLDTELDHLPSITDYYTKKAMSLRAR